MGVDIAGIAPQINEERPKEPVWAEASEYEKDLYYAALHTWHVNNPGVYFRSSWWGWRPIHVIADMAIKVVGLPFDTSKWSDNMGEGLKTQEECDQLADAIEVFMALNHANMYDLEDRFYLCLGMWTRSDNSFVPGEIENLLNEDYPMGTIIYRGVVDMTGKLAFPTHSVPLYYVHNFVTFLRKCGGFEIW